MNFQHVKRMDARNQNKHTRRDRKLLKKILLKTVVIPSSPKSVKLSEGIIGKILMVPTGKGISHLTYAMANK